MFKLRTLLVGALIASAGLLPTEAQRHGSVLRGGGTDDTNTPRHLKKRKKKDEKDEPSSQATPEPTPEPTDPKVVDDDKGENRANPADMSSSEIGGMGGSMGTLLAAAASVLPALNALATGGDFSIMDLLPIVQQLGTSPFVGNELPASNPASTPNIGDANGTTPSALSGDFTDYGPPKPLYIAKPTTEEPIGERLGGEMFQLDFSNLENPTFQKLADNGFGNHLNKYMWSQAINDNGDVCVGTFNVNYFDQNVQSYYDSISAGTLTDPQAPFDGYARLWSGSPITYTEGGEVYCKMGGEANYVLTYKLPSDHTGLRNMVWYNGKFYAGSANGPDGPEPGVPYSTSNLYSAEGGPGLFRGGSSRIDEPWERVDDEGFLNGFDRSVRAMCVSSTTNRLYIGTESVVTLGGHRARVLSYDAINEKWESYDLNPLVGVVTQCIDIGAGKMLFASSGVGNIQLWVIDELNKFATSEVTGDVVKTFTDNYSIKTGGQVPTPLNIILEFSIFKGMLYTGFLDGTGFQFYRTANPSDPSAWTWEPISLDGFSEEQVKDVGARVSLNAYTWCSAQLGEFYFIGTLGSANPSIVDDGSQASKWAADDGRGQLWVSVDGKKWHCLNADAFGEPWTIGLRTMTADPKRGLLHIGTASDFFRPVRSRAPYVV